MQQFRGLSRTRTTYTSYSTETHTSDFILNTLCNRKPVVFSGEVLSGGDRVPREQGRVICTNPGHGAT